MKHTSQALLLLLLLCVDLECRTARAVVEVVTLVLTLVLVAQLVHEAVSARRRCNIFIVLVQEQWLAAVACLCIVATFVLVRGRDGVVRDLVLQSHSMVVVLCLVQRLAWMGGETAQVRLMACGIILVWLRIMSVMRYHRSLGSFFTMVRLLSGVGVLVCLALFTAAP